MLSTLKNRIKKELYDRIGITFNPHGVPFVLGKHLAGRRNISLIDVGAHEGEFTTAIDRLCGVDCALLIELQPAHAARLRERFKPPRFQVVQAAVCDQAGELEVEINQVDATTSILRTKRGLEELSGIDVGLAATIRCPAMTLDMLFKESGLSSIDVLKLDVQGAEHLVIHGGRETLSRTTMIWTEVSFKALYEDSCLYQDVADLLTDCGFALYELHPGFRGPRGELLQADALFVRI